MRLRKRPPEPAFAEPPPDHAGTPAPEVAAVAYEPALVPPLDLMRTEGIDVLEDWFRWAEEWSMLLRAYGDLGDRSRVLEIGCGLGRVAFPLRYVLLDGGSYDGFEIAREKVAWLQESFEPAHPNFRFRWADVHNAYYNPGGAVEASDFEFPYPDRSFDVVFAASVFTHMLPGSLRRYVAEAARVLAPGGRCVFSFLLLDNYEPARPRPLGFARPGFAFDHRLEEHGDDFGYGVPENPEEMTAYRLAYLERLAGEVGLRLARDPLPGMWSGAFHSWVGSQDVLVLEHTETAAPR